MGYTNGQPIFGKEDWHNYVTLDGHMGDREVYEVKSTRTTVTLERRKIGGDCIVVWLDATPIVIHWQSGGFQIWNGGWYTRQTMSRMNEFMPHNWSVYQENYFWYVSFREDGDWDKQRRWPYSHHFQSMQDGTFVSHNGREPEVIKPGNCFLYHPEPFCFVLY